MRWPHICGRSRGWKRVVFTVLHWWRMRTGYYARVRAERERQALDAAVQRLAHDIDRRAFEQVYRNVAAADDCGTLLCTRPTNPLAPGAFREFCGRHRRLHDAYLRGSISNQPDHWTP